MISRLHSERRATRPHRAARLAVVALMLGLWLGLIGASSSARLHGFLHADADHPAHDCLVTHFAKSQLLTAGGAVCVVTAILAFLTLPLLAEWLMLPVADIRLPSSRGPPVSSLLP